MTKQWWKSKTLWFNILALIVAVAAGLGFSEFQAEPWVGGVATAVVTVINLVLRLWFTDTKLTANSS